MADNKGSKNPWQELWKELTKPPKWMKDADNKPDAKKDNGKKAEADASTRPKKRQPPSWWSWSQSDGVPVRKQRKQARRSSGSASGEPHSPKPRSAGSSRRTDVRVEAGHRARRSVPRSRPGGMSPLSNSRDDPSRTALSGIQGMIRRHGFAPNALNLYGLTATKVEPFGPVLRLRTNRGLIALKKSILAPKQILFLHEALTYAAEKNYTRYAPFVLTANGQPYVQVGGETYYATQWIRGQEVNFRSMQQLAASSRSLAEFHEATRGFEPKGYRPEMLFDMVPRFRDRRDELAQWKRRLERKSRKDDVDLLYLKLIDPYLEQADRAIGVMKGPSVRAHLLYEEEDPVLCHLDLTPYNMVWAQNGQVYLIDLDFCSFGPRTLDVAHLLRRALQRSEWEEGVARHVLVNYNSLRMMSLAEYELLYGLLLFPHRFWRIAYQHYELGHDPHHLGFFQLAEAEEERRNQFLTQFGKQVQRMGGGL